MHASDARRNGRKKCVGYEQRGTGRCEADGIIKAGRMHGTRVPSPQPLWPWCVWSSGDAPIVLSCCASSLSCFVRALHRRSLSLFGQWPPSPPMPGQHWAQAG
jgi:hypothetical protein